MIDIEHLNMNDIKEHIRFWAFLAAALLLAACTADDPSAESGNGKSEVHLMPYMQSFHDVDPTTRRALPTGYTSFNPTNVMQMEVYLAHDEQITTSTLTNFPKQKVWNSSYDIVANKEYKIYGFMPRKIGSDHSATYQPNGIDLTLNNLPPFTDKDLCVITGVLQGSKGGDISTSDIVLGKFNYTGKSAEDGNYIYLLLDHIYASLEFQFKVDAEYAKLRIIKLKEVKLTTQVTTASVTLNIRENNEGKNPITNAMTWTPTSGTSEYTVYSSDNSDGTVLTTSYEHLATAQFAPVSGADNMTMTCTYNVYTADGNTLVGNRTAVNNLSSIVGLTSGRKRKIKISVEPTYLYILADPDLDNPTITID